MRIYLRVRCAHCTEFYNIRYTTDQYLLGYRLDFSICSHCGMPRNQTMSDEAAHDWHCEGCNIPGKVLTGLMRVSYRKIGKYCNLCFMADWYEWKNGKRFKREVAIKREIVCL